MKRILVIYQSIKGHTKVYGENMGNYFKEMGTEAIVVPVDKFKNEQLQGITHVMLGCWTSGLFIMFQHPDQTWNKFAEKVSLPAGIKTGLFTTYKLATGSMFNKMLKKLHMPADSVAVTLKSKTGALSDSDKASLADFINS